MTSGGSGDGVHQPHDALFRRVFGDPKHAGSELRSVLSAEVAAPTDIADIIKVSDHAATAFADLLPHTYGTSLTT